MWVARIFIFRRFVQTLYRCQGTGLPRVAEFIRRMYAKRHVNTEVVIDDFGGGAKFVCDLGEHMGSQIFWRDHYSGDQLKVLDSLLRPGSVFVDLGANQGEFTVFAASRVGECGRVFAFEPSPMVVQRLLRNVALNGFTHVSIEQMAVSDKPGHLDLFTPVDSFEDGTINAGLPSLYSRAHGENNVATKVPVTTLDAWQRERGIERVDVIKLDIEGAELPALKGGEELIRRFRPALIIELNSKTCDAAGYTQDDLVDWLLGQGYSLSRIGANGSLSPLRRRGLGAFQNILASPQT